MNFDIREITSFEDYQTLVSLQHSRGNVPEKNVIPGRNILTAINLGGTAVGLFNTTGELNGFSFYFPGSYKGKVVGWRFRSWLDSDIDAKIYLPKIAHAEKTLASEKGIYALCTPVNITNKKRVMDLLQTPSVISSRAISSLPVFLQDQHSPECSDSLVMMEMLQSAPDYNNLVPEKTITLGSLDRSNVATILNEAPFAAKIVSIEFQHSLSETEINSGNKLFNLLGHLFSLEYSLIKWEEDFNQGIETMLFSKLD